MSIADLNLAQLIEIYTIKRASWKSKKFDSFDFLASFDESRWSMPFSSYKMSSNEYFYYQDIIRMIDACDNLKKINKEHVDMVLGLMERALVFLKKDKKKSDYHLFTGLLCILNDYTRNFDTFDGLDDGDICDFLSRLLELHVKCDSDDDSCKE